MTVRAYAGLDRSEYPGDEVVRFLAPSSAAGNANVSFLAQYIGGPNAAPETATWKGKRGFLVSLGYGLAPVYVGQQDDPDLFHSTLTAAQGQEDAQEASSLMIAEGYPDGSYVYLDVEGGGSSVLSEDLIGYVVAWAGEIEGETPFQVGIYTGKEAATQILAALSSAGIDVGKVRLWTVADPAKMHACDKDRTDTYFYDTPWTIPQTFDAPDPTEHHEAAYMVQWCLDLGPNPCWIIGGGTNDAPEWISSWDFDSALGPDPSAPDKEEPAPVARPGYPERKLSVTADNWLYDVQTNTWVKLPDFPNATIETDKSGWPYIASQQPAPSPTPGGGKPTADQIVAAALEVEGAPYRIWKPGDAIPMWLDDGYPGVPPASFFAQNGIMCSDLINYALLRCSLPPGGGTYSFANYLIEQVPFDPSTPGIPGAIAYIPYMGPAVDQQGHIALYVDEHTLIQALIFGAGPGPGVTTAYTDAQTYAWGGDTAFTTYALLPGVDYSKYL